MFKATVYIVDAYRLPLTSDHWYSYCPGTGVAICRSPKQAVAQATRQAQQGVWKAAQAQGHGIMDAPYASIFHDVEVTRVG